jgi:hypothetical protein
LPLSAALRILTPAVLALVLLAARSALADQTARLVYARGLGAEACPDEGALRTAVAARLGYDPFRPVAALTVIASVSRVGSVYSGDVRLLGERGDEVGLRSIGQGSERCDEIVATVALSISVAIDPLLLVRPPSAPPPPPPAASLASDAPPPGPVAPAESPPVPPVRAAPARPVHPFVGFALVGSVLSAPAAAIGAALSAGGRVGMFSLAAEARADLPSPTGTSKLSSFLVLGTVAPCVHASVVFGCAFASAGVLTAAANGITNPQTARAVYGALGPRAGVELPIGPHVALRASLDLGVPLVRYPLEVNHDPATKYSPSAVWLAMAVGATYHF